MKRWRCRSVHAIGSGLLAVAIASGCSSPGTYYDGATESLPRTDTPNDAVGFMGDIIENNGVVDAAFVQPRLTAFRETTGYRVRFAFVDTFNGLMGGDWVLAYDGERTAQDTEFLIGIATKDWYFSYNFDDVLPLTDQQNAELFNLIAGTFGLVQDGLISFNSAVISVIDALEEAYLSSSSSTNDLTSPVPEGNVERESQLFLSFMREDWSKYREEALLAAGEWVCAQLDDGLPMMALIMHLFYGSGTEGAWEAAKYLGGGEVEDMTSWIDETRRAADWNQLMEPLGIPTYGNDEFWAIVPAAAIGFLCPAYQDPLEQAIRMIRNS